jgi:RNA polymerase primary sigma factor
MIETPIAQYLKNISVFPLLTQEEEVNYAIAARSGDEDAREALINSNLRLVVSIAKNYRNFHLDLMDFIQAGNRGLIKAVDKYDPTLLNPSTNKPYRFSTYAVNWIKQSIAKEIADNGRIIRNPANIIAAITKYNTAITRWTNEHGTAPSDAEVAEQLNVDLSTIANYKRWSADVNSLDGIVISSGDGKDVSLIDFVADEAPTPDQVAARNDEERLLKQRYDSFDDRTKLFMVLKYGLGEDYMPITPIAKIKGLKRIPAASELSSKVLNSKHTLEEISQLVGLTRERIRQIIARQLNNCAAVK